MDYQKIIDLVQSTKHMILDGSTYLNVTEKGPADFVTQIDFKVQEYLIKELEALHPHIQIMAEEKDNQTVDFSKPVWILDPIDGTTNLVHGYRHSAVSLALHDGEKIAFGVVYNPYADETFHAEAGKGCCLNNERIRVSKVGELKDSLIMVGTASYFKELADEIFAEIFRAYRHCGDIRRTGSAALDLAYVASGRVEGYFERNLKPWDIAAGMLLVQEAGGRVCGYSGEELMIRSLNDIVADNGDIHEEFLRVVKG
ncbi:MAG: Archaeal fructose,6-bisphosphatase of inositol monophosphatase family [Firmicutes bacterium]|nr:Archaeal fructose,6-bisphosphatase of inositol monophosphatase family [Bacillota bacterium]